MLANVDPHRTIVGPGDAARTARQPREGGERKGTGNHRTRGGEPSKSYTIQNAHKPRAAVFTLQCKV